MTRATLRDVRFSTLPETIGKCQADVGGIAAVVNEATQRLIHAGGETGWCNGWQKVVFSTLSQTDPYITLPRQFARIINMAVCTTPIRINNEFFEVLPGGVGIMPPANTCDWQGNVAGYERGTVPTMRSVDTTNQLLRVYYTDARDVGKRVLITGLDQNGLQIYSQDGLNSVNGFYLTLQAPFDTSSFIVTDIQFVQKDITYGDVLLYQVDATTGVQVLLSRYAPDEINPSYRRYYITRLPINCCQAGTATTLQVTALAKLEYIPVSRDTDQLLISNIPALKEECLSIRYGDMDTPNAAMLEDKHHKQAIRLLQNELRHQFGEQQPAVNVDTFGYDLTLNSVGTLI